MLAMSGADLNAKNKNDETPSGKKQQQQFLSLSFQLTIVDKFEPNSKPHFQQQALNFIQLTTRGICLNENAKNFFHMLLRIIH